MENTGIETAMENTGIETAMENTGIETAIKTLNDYMAASDKSQAVIAKELDISESALSQYKG